MLSLALVKVVAVTIVNISMLLIIYFLLLFVVDNKNALFFVLKELEFIEKCTLQLFEVVWVSKV